MKRLIVNARKRYMIFTEPDPTDYFQDGIDIKKVIEVLRHAKLYRGKRGRGHTTCYVLDKETQLQFRLMDEMECAAAEAGKSKGEERGRG